MRSREGINSSSSSSSKGAQRVSQGNQPGKVFGVLLNENTPSSELFKTAGGWDGLGTIYYMDYDLAKNIENPDLSICKTAKPLFPNQKQYPLIGEVVLIFDLPSNQEGNTVSQKYYLSIISIWNNNHHNAQTLKKDLNLGKTFKENPSVGTLLPSEGDVIYEGRFGSSLRFGSTTSLNKIIDGSPITMLVNNHAFYKNSLKPYIENINFDGSSVYLTSTQTIDLKNDFDSLNTFTNTVNVNKYNSNQIIFNSDRVILNSKKDEVLLFAKTNIEFYTKQIISANAEERVHLNSPLVFLGRNGNKLPDEPVLLGNKTVRVLKDIISELSKFSSTLKSSASTPAGTPLIDINMAATQLTLKLKGILNRLGDLTSEQTFTA